MVDVESTDVLVSDGETQPSAAAGACIISPVSACGTHETRRCGLRALGVQEERRYQQV